MSHARTQIRDMIVTALRAIEDMKWSVFASRVIPVPETSLPVILVYTTEEAISTETMGPPRTQIRSLAVMVDLIVQAQETYDDDLDAMQVNVEDVLGGSAFLATMNTAKVKNIALEAANKTMSGEPTITTCATRMEYRVEYVTRENDPETLI